MLQIADSKVGRRVGTLVGHTPGLATHTPPPHPLDPLSEAELLAASKACREYAEKLDIPPLRFNSVAAQVGRQFTPYLGLSGANASPTFTSFLD